MICNEFEDEDIAFAKGENRLYALLNNKGEFLTDFVYNNIYGGSEEGLFECKRNGKHGHIDINGKEIIPCIYDDGNYFSEGIAAECLNNKWGMVDYFNNTIIPFEYEEIDICKNNIIPAQKCGKWGLINKSNEILVNFIYDDINCWGTRECLAVPAKFNGRYGLIDKHGEIVEEFIYEDIQVVSDNNDNFGEFIVIKKDNKLALYSAKNKTFLTNFIYDKIGYVSENRFRVRSGKKYNYIDTNGIPITPLTFDDAEEFFHEGVAIVTKNNKKGMINLNGELVIPCEYQKLHSCRGNLILAKNSKGETGYIDKNNNIVIPFGKYDCASDFYCDLAIVYSEEFDNIYIDKTGKVIELKVQ